MRRPAFLLLDDANLRRRRDCRSADPGGMRDELDTTTLIVAHRVYGRSTLAAGCCSCSEGRIVATGTHTELLESNPDYEDMVRATTKRLRERAPATKPCTARHGRGAGLGTCAGARRVNERISPPSRNDESHRGRAPAAGALAVLLQPGSARGDGAARRVAGDDSCSRLARPGS